MAAEANEEKPINQQLEELWTQNGEKRGVPQGIRRLLNTAFTNVQVSSFPDLPSGKGKVNEEMQSFFFSFLRDSGCLVLREGKSEEEFGICQTVLFNTFGAHYSLLLLFVLHSYLQGNQGKHIDRKLRWHTSTFRSHETTLGSTFHSEYHRAHMQIQISMTLYAQFSDLEQNKIPSLHLW
jgi:hypothetical protein